MLMTYLTSMGVLLLQMIAIADCRLRSLRHQNKTPAVNTRRTLDYRDCGSNPDRPIQILNVTATPLPIRAPGKFRLSAAVNVTSDLPEHMGVDLVVSKSLFGFSFKIPCVKNIGTCHYSDVCGMLQSHFGRRRRCPKKLARNNIPCLCPIPPGEYTLNRISFRIPPLGGFLEVLAKGEYDISVRVFNELDKTELACFQAKFQIRQKKTRRRKTS